MAQLDETTRPASGRALMDQGRDALASLGRSAEGKAKEIVAASRGKIDEIKKKSLEDLYEDTKGFIRQNPGKSLLGGLAVGFLLGRVFRRR